MYFYDSNDISLDGDLDKSFSEDVAGRFKAYNWHYFRVEDGNDLDAIDQAIEEAKQSDKPSLIEVKTVIGYGAPNKSGKSDAHGSPLGEAERQGAYEAYGLDHLKTFDVDDSVYERFNETLIARGESEETAWNEVLESFKTSNEAAYNDFTAAVQRELPKDYADKLPVYEAGTKKATRGNSGDMIQELSKAIPTFFGGAADLAGSNKQTLKKHPTTVKITTAAATSGSALEIAMAAAINGMAAHGGLYPYAGTFFFFCYYLTHAVRLSALIKLPVTSVFTHDSFAVGEDVPTHEPVEQLAGLRAIPNLNVIRPADGNETREAWKTALESVDTPTALVLTRQDLPVLDIDSEVVKEGVKRGGYIAYDGGSDAIVFATGSEVSLAVATAEKLAEDGVNIKVASIPNVQAFLNQDEAYIESVLNTDIDNRTAVEMAASLGWHRFVGIKGKLLTIDTFGASAPGGEVVERYGFTVENLSNIIRNK